MPPVQGQLVRARGQRLERLNALRGPAAILVVLYHVRQIASIEMGSAGAFEFWRFGHAGVDLFFVLSGFVIYWVHRRDVGKPLATRHFLARRLIRVYPPMWIVTTGVLIGALVAAHAVHAEKMNVWFIVRSYLLWPIQGALPLLPPAWTLSHEVKFYALFAVAIAAPRRVWRPVLAAALIGSVVTGVVETVAPTVLPFAVAFVFSPYNLEFAAGVAIAAYVRDHRIPAPSAWGAIGLIAWVIAATRDQSLAAPDVAQVIRYAVPSAIIVLAVAALDLQWPPFHRPALKLFGDASYAIYLIHLPVVIVAIRLAARLGMKPNVLTLVAVAVAATVAGLIFHRAIERPVTRYLTGRFAAKPPVVVRATATVE
jgi:peptidoglycan/LPS O-acetylase OafA/YrhL